ncbi:sensor histidine kinase [Neolewinella persica]|uniref:sensor histidine kinase n=1 Tax=Neolewinella persica TaxID=70998 RepID=UPI0003798B84|nr:histidine kinase [Neolewinella persica]
MVQKRKLLLRGNAGILLLSNFWLLSGIVLLDLNIELSGASFMLIAIFSFAYFLLTWWLFRRGTISLTPGWIKWESIGLASLISAGSLGATFECFPKEPFLVFLFAEISALSLYFIYLVNKDLLVLKAPIQKWGSRKLWWPAFGIAVTMLLLVMTAYEFEPVVNLLAILYFLALFVLGIRWLLEQRRKLIVMKKAQMQMELTHLQSQVNPHFFFNALNNLYGLVKQDTDEAQEMILQLSDMMSYGIYEGQKQSVPLEKEVAYLENFIRLHQKRYRKHVEVDFRKDLGDVALEVMPLLFINLLENAFKHGVEKLRDNAYVHLDLKVGEQGVTFTVENNFDPEERPADPGIGLTNLKRRLELVYPDGHSLSLSEENEVFRAELIIFPSSPSLARAGHAPARPA